MMFRVVTPVAIVLALFTVAARSAHASDRVTYSKDIAPILQRACQRCHRPNQAAPMSLLTFDEVRPWAKAIRTAVVNRIMPPWHADPRYGSFVNDARLTEDEIDTIVGWVDSGAIEGDESDLPEPAAFTDGWTIGEPDLILTMDETYRVPASGRDRFEYFMIPTGLTEDRFVSAVEVMPGNRRVVHHVLAYVHQRDDYDFRDEASFEDSIGDGGTLLIEYGLGNNGDIFPEGTGRLLKRGSRLWLQIHYHPYGEATTDRTSIGLKFYPKGTDCQRIISRWIGARDLSIPPRTKNVPSEGAYTFRRPVRIVSFQPHMHCRGQSMMAKAYYPDGSSEILVSVPNFDFNWQTTYIFEEPPLLPPGTRLHVYAAHDNTAENPNNPNPNSYVSWGQETTDEMMHGWTDFIYADETPGGTPTPIQSPMRSRSERVQISRVENGPREDLTPRESAPNPVDAPARTFEPRDVDLGTSWQDEAPKKSRGFVSWIQGLVAVGAVALIVGVRRAVR